MKLVDQWRTIEENLPARWEDVRLTLTTEQPGDLPRAAQVLAPLGPGKVRSTLVLRVRRAGGAQGPEAARRLFARLDESRTWAQLEQVQAHVDGEGGMPDERGAAEVPVAATWDAALAPLPAGWSDLLCELEVDSSDYLDRAALLCAPLNPTREAPRLAFTFRCSGRSGYGVSPGMARRCFERLDGAGISGRTRVLRVLCDTDNVDTQGPVWLVGGKTL
ncbi:hypothetical protein Gocc_2974 [Gaiella occulta]|uniref:Uncharacterized protein n=1 Tax=Gaiella occulta TaxID=1002870 RepID=A0A7M2YU04_9ACTN|nr:hypothetical protein [Gaiella occulta]RDI73374.1 hypothetical protein Gocc_2974 [Gaiella occulta]